MSDWKALNARVTALVAAPSPTPSESVLDLYRRFWRSDPDNFQKSPNPLVPARAQGSRDGLMAVCAVAPNRIDFHLQPAGAQEELIRPTLQLIEDTARLRAEVAHIATEIGNRAPAESVVRVAVSLQFVNVGAGLQEANRKVAAVIPEQYRVRLTDEEAFVLQIGRSHASRSNPNTRLNAVTKWSVEQLQVVTFSVPMGVQPTPQPAVPSIQNYLAASVMFECNSGQAGTVLNAAQQSSYLQEGLTLAAEVQRNYGLNVEGF